MTTVSRINGGPQAQLAPPWRYVNFRHVRHFDPPTSTRAGFLVGSSAKYQIYRGYTLLRFLSDTRHAVAQMGYSKIFFYDEFCFLTYYLFGLNPHLCKATPAPRHQQWAVSSVGFCATVAVQLVVVPAQPGPVAAALSPAHRPEAPLANSLRPGKRASTDRMRQARGQQGLTQTEGPDREEADRTENACMEGGGSCRVAGPRHGALPGPCCVGERR